jgi:hypothetical protein
VRRRGGEKQKWVEGDKERVREIKKERDEERER